MGEEIRYRIDKFHAHLDICIQCRNHPFDLCKEGTRLLMYAVTGIRDEREAPSDSQG